MTAGFLREEKIAGLLWLVKCNYDGGTLWFIVLIIIILIMIEQKPTIES